MLSPLVIFLLIVIFTATAALGWLFGYMSGRAWWLLEKRRRDGE